MLPLSQPSYKKNDDYFTSVNTFHRYLEDVPITHIPVRNPSLFQERKLAYVFNLFLSFSLIMLFCIEHSNDTTLLHEIFQNDRSIKMTVRDGVSVWEGHIFILLWAPGYLYLHWNTFVLQNYVAKILSKCRLTERCQFTAYSAHANIPPSIIQRFWHLSFSYN